MANPEDAEHLRKVVIAASEKETFEMEQLAKAEKAAEAAVHPHQKAAAKRKAD